MTSDLTGPVTRCRGPFLYTRRGRWLDLDRMGGRALFGWNDPRVMSRYRNEVARGLTGLHPGFWPRRLTVLLRRRFPSLFPSVEAPGCLLPNDRPWAPSGAPEFRLILPDLNLGVVVVLTEREPENPGWHGVSSASLAATCAALGTWEACGKLEPEHWEGWDDHGFHRKGPWLSFQGSEQAYLDWSSRMLAEKILVPPDGASPICLPWEPADAERKRWNKLMARFSP